MGSDATRPLLHATISPLWVVLGGLVPDLVLWEVLGWFSILFNVGGLRSLVSSHMFEIFRFHGFFPYAKAKLPHNLVVVGAYGSWFTLDSGSIRFRYGFVFWRRSPFKTPCSGVCGFSKPSLICSDTFVVGSDRWVCLGRKGWLRL